MGAGGEAYDDSLAAGLKARAAHSAAIGSLASVHISMHPQVTAGCGSRHAFIQPLHADMVTCN